MDNKIRYNPEIHHRRSIRLKGYDYSTGALYFITFCCDKRQHLFCEIEHDEMILSDAGVIAHQCWHGIPQHFPNAVLHEYVVMPNHVHGIIELLPSSVSLCSDKKSLQPFSNDEKSYQIHEFQKMIPRSIASIIKGYKIGVTKWFRANTEVHTVWQRNYYDHIIRNEQSYQTISEYIRNNPARWEQDKFYK